MLRLAAASVIASLVSVAFGTPVAAREYAKPCDSILNDNGSIDCIALDQAQPGGPPAPAVVVTTASPTTGPSDPKTTSANTPSAEQKPACDNAALVAAAL